MQGQGHHDIFDIAPLESEVALIAFGKACGEWIGRSAKHQFLLRPQPNRKWVGYILKDVSQQVWNPLGVTENLLSESIKEHGEMLTRIY